MVSLNLGAQSALDLTLRGSAGSFSVKYSDNENSTLDVKYFLTHINLNFENNMGGSQSEKLLKELAPFREIFDTSDLHFDEILQRDIDDARVSSKLIPYILDKNSNNLVKFFPPIVIFAIPLIGNKNSPSDYYPEVTTEIINKEMMGIDKWFVTRSGKVGTEVFQFEQPLFEDVIQEHDLVNFKVNTNKCKLVIVDGQHRAMALLALYRNLKDDWGHARRAPYKSYYEEWDREYVSKFDLSKIQMPAIICTVPELNINYKGDYTLKNASRSIFLTLNKNAQPVSRSRTRLLDDSDLVSSFMRDLLDQIKSSSIRSEGSLKIHNIELDQHSQQKIKNPIAISSVTHLYYIIEHILFVNGDVNGVSDRSGSFGKRTTNAYFENSRARLKCSDFFRENQCSSITRNIFSRAVEEKLTSFFSEKYSLKILSIMYKFHPIETHNYAANALFANMEGKGDLDVISMMFGGQNGISVFQDHRNSLKERVAENLDVTPKLKIIVENLDRTNERLNSWGDKFNEIRAEKFIDDSSKKDLYKLEKNGNLHHGVISIINQLYDNLFSTVAFQAGITCTFFGAIEDSFGMEYEHADIKYQELFDEYLNNINKFFKVTCFDDLIKLTSLFIGHTDGSDALNMSKPLPNSRISFRQVVSPTEMKPDSWPRFRYLFLELWEAKDNQLKTYIDRELEVCRKQIFESVFSRNKKSFSQENSIPSEKMSDEQSVQIFDESFEQYKEFLSKYFRKGSRITKSQFKS